MKEKIDNFQKSWPFVGKTQQKKIIVLEKKKEKDHSPSFEIMRQGIYGDPVMTEVGYNCLV